MHGIIVKKGALGLLFLNIIAKFKFSPLPFLTLSDKLSICLNMHYLIRCCCSRFVRYIHNEIAGLAAIKFNNWYLLLSLFLSNLLY